jgi:hypothetical protein
MADLTAMMQAAAGAAGDENLYIEDVFSTYLYAGDGSTQTITNDIDLDGEGGLVWAKSRDAAEWHSLCDTARGVNSQLFSNATNAASASGVTQFNSNGYATTGSQSNLGSTNYVSWTFRKAPKFFDIVTYTGTGVARTVAHNLGSVPGCIIVKCTSDAEGWFVYHRSESNTENGYLNLNSPWAVNYTPSVWNNTTPTSSVFTLGTRNEVNGTGKTFVAYLFAHDDGGFGDDGEQNVISCGTYTIPGAPLDVNLGYEPQFLLIKRTDTTGDWYIIDTMRGFTVSDNPVTLKPNSSDSEGGLAKYRITNTGFGGAFDGGDSGTYIYIAIRRGPMKTPESGTEVFSPVARTGTNVSTTVNTTVRPDAIIQNWRAGAYGSSDHYIYDRLRGFTYSLFTNTSDAEANQTVSGTSGMGNSSYGILNTGMNASGGTFVDYALTRAPGFFDVVCYTGTGSATTVAHNLGVAPELMIIKLRNAAPGAASWIVYPNIPTQVLFLNTTGALATNAIFFGTAPTASVFTLGGGAGNNNDATGTYVAYLFASLAGVSDIGTYTGNGTSVSVTTGFQPRFILVKRTDSTGNWIVGDSARGLVAGDDPFLLLNTTAAETTNQDWVDVSATGFTVNETAANANVNTGTYIYLAIA